MARIVSEPSCSRRWNRTSEGHLLGSVFFWFRKTRSDFRKTYFSLFLPLCSTAMTVPSKKLVITNNTIEANISTVTADNNSEFAL